MPADPGPPRDSVREGAIGRSPQNSCASWKQSLLLPSGPSVHFDSRMHLDPQQSHLPHLQSDSLGTPPLVDPPFQVSLSLGPGKDPLEGGHLQTALPSGWAQPGSQCLVHSGHPLVTHCGGTGVGRRS